MKRRIQCLVGAGIAASILATTAPAASAVSVPDASCTVPPGVNIVQSDGNRKIAQTFTAIHTGGMDTVQMSVKNPTGTTPGDWRLEIAAATGGTPGPVLASTTVPNTLAANVQGPITGTFSSPPAVTAGGNYAVLLSRPGSSGYQAAEEGGDPCPGRNFYQNVVSGPFIEQNFVDFGFATTVQLPAPTPTSTSPAKKCKKKKHKKRAAVAKKHKKCKKKKRK
jgi:hypothetical protein